MISEHALNELFRNLRKKAPESEKRFADSLAVMDIEVVGEGMPDHIVAWRAAGLRNDAPIVAAAIEAEVDYLCTGDRGIHEMRHAIEAVGVKVISPRDLLELISDEEP